MSHQQRIQGAPEQGPLRKVAYGMARKRLGRVPEPFAVAAHHTKIFGAMSGFEMALERCHAVPERYKALGELRAAMVVGCEFCVDIGSMIARQSGLSDDELKDLTDWQASERLDEKDKLVLAGIWLDRRVVQLAIISWLAGASIHFVYHLVTIDRFGTGDAIANLLGLFVYIALPGGLLVRSMHDRAEDPGSTRARTAS